MRIGWAVSSVLVAAAVVGVVVWSSRQSSRTVPVASGERAMQTITLKSSAFAHDGMMPKQFTCDADDRSPPLELFGVSAKAKTLALIMHDPDAPRAGGWTHWVRFNIPVNGNVAQVESSKVTSLKFEEGKEPEGVAGSGTGGNATYRGPCPPSGTHRYFFTVYALDAELSPKEGATKAEVEQAMEGHVLGKGELIGLYSRKQ